MITKGLRDLFTEGLQDIVTSAQNGDQMRLEAQMAAFTSQWAPEERLLFQQTQEDGVARIRVACEPHRDGCTEETPHCPESRTYKLDTPECCRNHLRDLVFEMADLLDESGVTWWMDYGTLLGAVRSGGVIPHDKDQDLSFLATDWDKVRSLPIKEPRTFDHHPPGQGATGDNMVYGLSSVNRAAVDLFPWYDDGQHLYRKRYYPVDQFKGRDIPKDHLFPLTRIPFEGRDLPAPRNPEEFVAFRYGPDWKTPIRSHHDRVKR